MCDVNPPKTGLYPEVIQMWGKESTLYQLLIAQDKSCESFLMDAREDHLDALRSNLLLDERTLYLTIRTSETEAFLTEVQVWQLFKYAKAYGKALKQLRKADLVNFKHNEQGKSDLIEMDELELEGAVRNEARRLVLSPDCNPTHDRYIALEEEAMDRFGVWKNPRYHKAQ